MIAKLIHSRYLIWVLLAVPAIPFIDEFISPSRYYPEMMQRSGVLSVQLLVFSLSITPITLVLKPYNWGRVISRWLLAKRKYFGLAAAAYAAIHTIFYLRFIAWDIELAWLEALDWPFGTGWIAMILFILLAVFSNSWGVKTLGKAWKPIQRFSYIIAIASLSHWLLLDFFIDDALYWIVPLTVAKLIHIAFRVYPLFAKATDKLV